MEVFLVIFAFIVYWLIDSFGSKQFGYGIVIGKKFTEGRDRKFILRSGCGSQVPIPDDYELRIQIAHGIASKSVLEEVYNRFREGDRVSVVYYWGRLSKKVYIKMIGESTMDLDFMQTIPKHWWF